MAPPTDVVTFSFQVYRISYLFEIGPDSRNVIAITYVKNITYMLLMTYGGTAYVYLFHCYSFVCEDEAPYMIFVKSIGIQSTWNRIVAFFYILSMFMTGKYANNFTDRNYKRN